MHLVSLDEQAVRNNKNLAFISVLLGYTPDVLGTDCQGKRKATKLRAGLLRSE